MEFKPFTQQEMKMLVFNKVRRGIKYNSAVKQLKEEIKEMKKIHLSRLKLATITGYKQTHTALMPKQ